MARQAALGIAVELELTADAMRERVTAIALALPEATATSLTGQPALRLYIARPEVRLLPR